MPAHIIEEVVNSLVEVVPEGSTILELGTGKGTDYLVKKFNVLSVENRVKWHTGKSTLLHVPLKELKVEMQEFYTLFPNARSWYDPDILKNIIKNYKYDAILIDGPKCRKGSSRPFMYYFYDKIFDTSVPVLIDDLWRPSDWMVAYRICKVKDADRIDVRRNKFYYNNKQHEKIYGIIK